MSLGWWVGGFSEFVIWRGEYDIYLWRAGLRGGGGGPTFLRVKALREGGGGGGWCWMGMGGDGNRGITHIAVR